MGIKAWSFSFSGKSSHTMSREKSPDYMPEKSPPYVPQSPPYSPGGRPYVLDTPSYTLRGLETSPRFSEELTYSPDEERSRQPRSPSYCTDAESSWQPTSPSYCTYSEEELKEAAEELKGEDKKNEEKKKKALEAEENKHDHKTRYLLSQTKILRKWEALLNIEDLGFIYNWIGENSEDDSNALINFLLNNPGCTKGPVSESGKKLSAGEREMWDDIYNFKQTYCQNVFEKTEVCTRWEQKLKLHDAVFARFLRTRPTKNGKATEWFCKMAMEHPNFVQQPPGALLGDLDKESQQHWDCVKAWYQTYNTYWVETDEYNKNKEACRITTTTTTPRSTLVIEGNGSLESIKCAKTRGEPERQPRNLEEAVEATRRLKRKTPWSEEEKAREDLNALSAREGKAAWMPYMP
jgi:hypothetical protein